MACQQHPDGTKSINLACQQHPDGTKSLRLANIPTNKNTHARGRYQNRYRYMQTHLPHHPLSNLILRCGGAVPHLAADENNGGAMAGTKERRSATVTVRFTVVCWPWVLAALENHHFLKIVR